MTRKLLSLVLALMMLLSAMLVLASCGDDPGPDDNTECTDHVDNNADGQCDECGKVLQTACNHADNDADGKCDKCGKEVSILSDKYDWDTTEIIFQMTKFEASQTIPVGCERYLAGEDINAVDSIDSDIAERNADAYLTTKVSVKYQYYPNRIRLCWDNTGI